MTNLKQSIQLLWHQWAAVVIIFFAFFMSALVSERVFERMPHLEDELAYLYQARIFAGGQIVVESPEPNSAYWQPFVLDSDETGARFGKYTPGYPAVLAIGVLLGQLWVINAFLAALAVALVYRLAYEIFNADVAVIAALLTAFSPAALLLNGTLMSHTLGLFLATLFVYAYWCIERGKQANLWGIVAGLALGGLAASRPLTTVSIGLPFVVWSGARLLKVLLSKESKQVLSQRLWQTLSPLLLLSIFTIALASSIPAFSYVAAGDPQQNLYELVWDYDRIGFGEGHGRNRHRLEKALSHARFDLSLTAADLFGWQFEAINDEMIDHLQNESDYYPAIGYSFYLLPFGLLIGLFAVNRRLLMWRVLAGLIWAIVAIFWLWFPQNLSTQVFEWGTVASLLNVETTLIADETFSWIWILFALFWLYLPLLLYVLVDETPQIAYTWLLFSIVVGIVIVQMLYWIGSQRYSTRYYYEALTAASILTAIPFAWLINKVSSILKSELLRSAWRGLSYVLILGLCLFTLYNYSTPRIMALYRFNGISPELIQDIEALQTNDQDILVIVSGATSGDDRVRWRSYGALMAVTSPYLDSEIVVVRDFGSSRQRFVEAYPDRQVIDIYAVGNDAFIMDSRTDE